jgi:spermidine synthase
VKPWYTLATAPAGGGKELSLHERDGVFVIRVGGQELMSSARHGSEEAMAVAGLEGLKGATPSVLIGGLGLGYTLRAALDLLPARATVVVAEISPAVVEWNRGHLAALAQAPLEDLRVTVEVAEVARFVAKTSLRFDAILLDVDNGPTALSRPGNQHLYEAGGLDSLRGALNPGGVLVLWSAGPAPQFSDRLRLAGFKAEERRVPARKGSNERHTLFLGHKPRGR